MAQVDADAVTSSTGRAALEKEAECMMVHTDNLDWLEKLQRQMHPGVSLPNFFIIGAAKSGTTMLYTLLEQHPEVYMSPEKEPRFFALEGKPLDFRGPGDEVSNATAVHDPEAYLRLFSAVTKEKAVGEASTLYLFGPTAPQRISAVLPHAKLIAILRHPVERAYSNYLHLVRDGRETLDFEEALRQETVRTSVLHWSRFWYYKETGYYFEQLRRYYDLFDAGQIKVYLYEDLTHDAPGLMKDIYRFLGVDDAFKPLIERKQNVSGVPKHTLLHSLVFKRGSPVKALLRPIKSLLPGSMINTAMDLENRSLVKPELPPSLRAALVGDYREDILKLQQLIQRNLSHWLV